MSLLVDFPLIRKNGIDQRVPPSAFVVLILTQIAFKLHAQLLQYMRRTDIVSNAICPYAMYLKTMKPKIHDGMRRFRGISVIPIFGIQFIANICLERVRAIHADPAIPDKLV